MPVIDKAYYKLINEFSNINIRIITGNSSYSGEPVHDEKLDDFYPEYWNFDFCFQQDYFVRWGNSEQSFWEYQNWLENLRSNFNRELNDEIEDNSSQLGRLNLLTDYKLRFSELLENFVTVPIYINGIEKVIYINKKSKYEYTSDKEIEQERAKVIESEFLSIQVGVLNKILVTLTEKLKILELLPATNKSDSIKKAKKESMQKLDLYQTALLFYYLNEVGVIQYSSSNEIAPIVAQLTGHSEQNLRTSAFSNIIDIKKGLAGRKPNINVDKSLNIKKVKDVIGEIHRKIVEDLRKNDDIGKL